jgi:hypothetical protein
MQRHAKGFIADPFVVGILLFALFIILPIATNIGDMTTQAVLAENPDLNATQVATISNFGNNVFNNAPDIVAAVIYFILQLAVIIAARYTGADPAVTLVVGIIFLVIAEAVSFGLADVAHAYITQEQYINIAPHYSITTYIMEYLPYFNAIETIFYMIWVISKRPSEGGGGGYVSSRVISS